MAIAAAVNARKAARCAISLPLSSESSEDAIYGQDLDSIIASWNPAAERLFGYTAEEIIGRSIVGLFPLSRRDELLDIVAKASGGEKW